MGDVVMAISSFYNKDAVLIKQTIGGLNEFGEPTFTEVSTAFECALQPIISRIEEGWKVVSQGKLSYSTHKLYCALSVDIEDGDIVTIESQNYRVLLVSDGAGRGHHLISGVKLLV